MSGERFECHGHLMMDGEDFGGAWRRHGGGAHFSNTGVHIGSKGNLDAVRSELAALRDAGVTYFRDGGDALGVSDAARPLAAEYGIEYATPVFAIHRDGRYGGIVGRGYADEAGFRKRLAELEAAQADFAKLMISGIITFRTCGGLSCPSLEEEEIRRVIGLAHDAGFAVMLHINGAEAVKAAVRAGADSVEHAYFCDEEALELLAGSDTIWVPTLAAIDAFTGREGFDQTVVRRTIREQLLAVGRASRMGAKIASGSDSGAVGVPHGPGTLREYELLARAGVPEERILAANREIRERFRRR